MRLAVAVSGAALALAQSTAPAPAGMMTQESVNVFRRFAVDRAKDLEFYGEVIGLPPLRGLNMPGSGQMSLFHVGTSQFKFRLGPHSANVLNLWTAHAGAAANTYTAGIQYVVSEVDAVDARAKARGVRITQPLGMFGRGLRTVWLADPDGITNYFAQILRTPATQTP